MEEGGAERRLGAFRAPILQSLGLDAAGVAVGRRRDLMKQERRRASGPHLKA
jgi:hypothetical protein